MVKRKKHDKDKYYNLARQQGYRARSAFKLIQLNKKYDFLSKAKVCIDLCAAPGGWCQVAAKYMPVSSIILGIDLLPIRPIPNVRTFQCDITTQRCRQIIKQELQTWAADVVLCDGAPNVGADYSKDAFVQNELALIALKLAVDVLQRGGTFVTKVFRSQDYNALLWIFKQLFKSVSATKPLSSRNESAEIFVVCEQYLAPQSIDPKLLDPKYVFSQVDDGPDKSLTIFHPKFGDRKRHREGYDESLGVTLTNRRSVTEFIESVDPIRFLTDVTSIAVLSPKDEIVMSHKKTTDEIKHCLKDIKVLGKSEFKRLLKWRTIIQTHIASFTKENSKREEKNVESEKNVDEKTKTPEEQDAEKEKGIREELAQARISIATKKKRTKKKERERKAKHRLRIAMGMEQEGINPSEQDLSFDLASLGVKKSDDVENVGLAESSDHEDIASDAESTDGEDSDYPDILEKHLDSMYVQYLSDQKSSVGPAVRQKKLAKVVKRAIAAETHMEDIKMFDGNSQAYAKLLNVEKSSDEETSDEEDSLVVKAPSEVEKDSEITSRWFSSNPMFEKIETKLPEMPKTDKETRREKRKQANERKERRDERRRKEADVGFELTPAGKDTVSCNLSSSKNEDDAKKSELCQEKKDLIRAGMGLALKKEEKSEAFQVVRKYDSENEEYDTEDRAKTLALGSMMMTHSKAKEMMDSSYNRYAWNDPVGLPEWFRDDEEQNYRPQVPVPKDVMDKMREKFIALASKPVKKVAEARMRKKKQELKKLKAAKKKAADIANLPDMSNREKMKSIEKTMRGAKLKKADKVYVVSTRGGRRSSGKDKAAKGQVKLVDPRMKSDKRLGKFKRKPKK